MGPGTPSTAPTSQNGVGGSRTSGGSDTRSSAIGTEPTWTRSRGSEGPQRSAQDCPGAPETMSDRLRYRARRRGQAKSDAHGPGVGYLPTTRRFDAGLAGKKIPVVGMLRRFPAITRAGSCWRRSSPSAGALPALRVSTEPSRPPRHRTPCSCALAPRRGNWASAPPTGSRGLQRSAGTRPRPRGLSRRSRALSPRPRCPTYPVIGYTLNPWMNPDHWGARGEE